LNKRFLEGFSEAQKSGLKEITRGWARRILRSATGESFGPGSEANAARAQMTSSAQNLEHALTGFQRAQVDLGEE